MLKWEGYHVEFIEGMSVRRQLAALMKPARAAREALGAEER